MQANFQLVLCTCPDRETALALARALVAERLAACVGVVPGVTSVYRWEGAIHEETELQLLIKTRTERIGALTARIGQLHPYEVPEIIAIPITAGSAAYLSWVETCTQD